jgi:hypothetical protein
MLNIFAEAMLIAARMGRLPDDANHIHRRSPRESQDIEALNVADRLRNLGR